MRKLMMKPCLLLLLLLICATRSYGQYWNWDFKLPRLKGVKKIQVTVTRWDYPHYKKVPEKSKSILYLNDEGLVVREDEYGQNAWFDTRNTYEYIGQDTEMTYIRIFVYESLGGVYVAGQRPAKGAKLQNTVEFVNEHSPQHREWRFYQLRDTAQKRLLNITSSDFDTAGLLRFSHYYSYENAGYTDSTAYQYKGDTVIATTYAVRHMPDGQFADNSSRQQNKSFVPEVKGREVSVRKKDTAGRTVYYELLSGRYAHMGSKTYFLYDKQGRYLGHRYSRDCDDCNGKWETGGERYSYDAKSRLKSVVSYHQGNNTMRYDLVYFE